MENVNGKEERKKGILCFSHRNKKCKEVATEEFLKGRLVLLLEIERPLSISHVFSKQSVFYFIKLSALFFSPLMLYFIFNPSLLFLPVFAGEISLYHVFLFLTVFWPLHGEQCCTFFTIHISMVFHHDSDYYIIKNGRVRYQTNPFCKGIVNIIDKIIE